MNSPNGNPPGTGQGGNEMPPQHDAGQVPPGGQPYYGAQGQPTPEEMYQAWLAQQGYIPPPQYPPYGFYAPPGAQAPPPPPNPDQAGIQAALNDMADKSGLGMLKGFLNMDDGEFWKGALVGAAVVLLMTNEDLRNSLINSAAKTAEAVKAGFGQDGDEEDTAPDEKSAAGEDNQESEA